MVFKFNMHYLRNIYIFFAFLSLNIFFFSTSELKANSFEINNIEISKPFENNFNKNEVINKGFQNAFYELGRSLIRSTDYSKIDNIGLNEIKSMIDSFSIKEEKFINKVYYVNLGVSFNKKKIYSYLNKKNIFPSQIKNEKFLFVPILIDENKNDLTIFNQNPVYENWNKIEERFYLINYVLPTEDLEDLEAIKRNYDLIENYDFKDIIKKYYLDNCIIALIYKNNQDIKILSKIITKDKVVIKNESFAKLDFKNPDLVESLIKELKNNYEDIWKEYNQINTSIKLPLIIRIDSKKLFEQIKFEKTLDQLDLVNGFSIKKLNKDHIFYEVIFNGTPTNFISIMKDKNYVFNTQKKIWILQ